MKRKINFRIQKILDKINNLDVKGQESRCEKSCYEDYVWIGKTNGNTKGCFKYNDVFTPKGSSWL
ncbi:hypothetical protein KQI42_10595 [Tissierella sp. MSJ-40]|uniref:Uncharacterized protein n=1 Tax=Tissierella simiarum TaxID=2841534 RepID=A0ABS6E7P7_9FIRM|nr:hypothetical protein [Tissierella simiarum]MBU5438460.1 hypothetical protein [Tissierella simiarum]